MPKGFEVMGEIIHTKRTIHNTVIYQIKCSREEAVILKGAMRNINVFSEMLFSESARIIRRGREGSTYYFEVPFSLRFKKNHVENKIACSKLETNAKIFYTYVIRKDKHLF